MICCFGWGKYVVPKTVDDIMLHVRGVRGPGKVPTWVIELVEMLSNEAEHVCKSLRLCEFSVGVLTSKFVTMEADPCQ